MPRKVLKVGIMPKEAFRERTIAITRGEYQPKRDEPKVWFESVQSMAQVLSNSNQELLKAIIRHEPDTMKELASITGRAPSNLSRTLHTMQRYGIVELEKRKGALKPIVKAKDFRIEIALDAESGSHGKASSRKSTSKTPPKNAVA